MKKKTSVVWRVYTEEEGGGRCNDCGTFIKCCGGSTTGLFTHLKKHPSKLKEVEEAQKTVKIAQEKVSKKRSFSESFLSGNDTPKIKTAFENATKYPRDHPTQVDFFLATL